MASVADVVRDHLTDSIAAKQRMLAESTRDLIAIAERLAQVIANGGTIYLCGNGGSAADAQHVAAELVGRFQRERRPLPSVALTTNTSILTAIGNDYSFEEVFVRQVRASLTGGDALVGISTSGRSKNVLLALAAARSAGALTVAFTGEPGEPLISSVDAYFRAPAQNTARVQECHIVAWHIICDLLERSLESAQET